MIFKEVDRKDFHHLLTHMTECEKGVIYGTQYPHSYEILDGTIEYASRQFVNEDVAKAYVAEHYQGIEIKAQMNLFDVLSN